MERSEKLYAAIFPGISARRINLITEYTGVRSDMVTFFRPADRPMFKQIQERIVGSVDEDIGPQLCQFADGLELLPHPQ